MRTVYLIHFQRPIPGWRAQHYIGVTRDLQPRLQRHSEGNSGPLFRAARDYGVGFDVVRTWEFDDTREAYDMERWLKEMKRLSRYCPACSANPTRTNGAHMGACERYAERLAERAHQRERYKALKADGLEYGRIKEIMRQERLNGFERRTA